MASRESVIDAKTRIPRVRALQRERIDVLLRRIREVRATLVVAPAGSGKTTALAQFAMVTDATTIWLRTDPLDGSVERFVAHLDHGWASALDLGVAGWTTIDDAIHGFEEVDDRRFRTWEAERLLNDVCGLPLSPEDVARLTQRIEGWAAGLQLFHLAVRRSLQRAAGSNGQTAGAATAGTASTVC